MDITSSQVENIVRKILGEMDGGAAVKSAPSARLPKTAKVAMLTSPKHIELKEFEIPALRDDDILVKVEGCGVCGTDVHEWKGDPFGIIPVTLGHEGTGEIVALGKNIKTDTAGNPIKVGDKLVTSVISCGECYICRNHPANTNLCDKQGVFGLIPHNDAQPLTGWFSTHILIRGKGATYFVVNDLDLKERMLLELSCVCVHALKRANATGADQLSIQSVPSGDRPRRAGDAERFARGLGVNHVLAIDGTPKRLEMAKKLGAKTRDPISAKRPLSRSASGW